MYGSSTQLSTRPKCWGKSSEYDTESRECRTCPFQESCRSEVIRTMNRTAQAQPAPSVASYYSQFQQQPVPQPVTYAQPQYLAPPQPQPAPAPLVPSYRQAPVPAPAPQAAPVTVQYQRAVPQPTAQVMPNQQYQPGQHDWYGRFQDPMFNAISTAPAPWRPQMQGESFFERMVKNAALAMVEAAVGQALLGVRQMILPPTPVDPHRDHVVDVTPDRPK